MEAERPRPSVQLPPLPPVNVPPVHLPARARVDHDKPEWEKRVGTIFFVLGIVLMANGSWFLALMCWFVLPGLIIKKRHG
jgi:hypothetical protein